MSVKKFKFTQEEANHILQDSLPEVVRAMFGISVVERERFHCPTELHSRNSRGEDSVDSHPSARIGRDGKGRQKYICSCGLNHDAVGLITEYYGIGKFDAYRKGYEMVGIDKSEIDFGQYGNNTGTYTPHTIGEKQSVSPLSSVSQAEEVEEAEPARPDRDLLCAFAQRAHENLLNNPEAMEFFHKLGFTDETIKQNWLGYCPNGATAAFKEVGGDYYMCAGDSSRKSRYRFIYPYLTYTKKENGKYDIFPEYAIAEVYERTNEDDKKCKYAKMAGFPAIFYKTINATSQKERNYVFVTEGIKDCLALGQMGFNAFSTVGTIQAGFEKWAKKHYDKNKVLILSLDSDKSGHDSIEKIAIPICDRLGIKYAIFQPEHLQDVNLRLKDWGEVLVKSLELYGNTEAVEKEIKEAVENATKLIGKPNDAGGVDVPKTAETAGTGTQDAEKPDSIEKLDAHMAEKAENAKSRTDAYLEEMQKKDYARCNLGNYLRSGLHSADSAEFSRRKKLSTGYAELDAVANGWKDGLYVLMGESGTGKTTFALQLAYSFAKTQPVLYITAEQNQFDLTNKILARLIFEAEKPVTINGDFKSNTDEHASRIVSNGYIAEHPERVASVLTEEILSTLDRITVHSGVMSLNVEMLENFILEYKDGLKADERPIIFIDYLQMIDSYENSRTHSQREELNEVVKNFKRIQNNHNAVMFVLSSVNRESYNRKLGLGSAKETGSIEYSANMVLALELYALHVPNKIKEFIADFDAFLLHEDTQVHKKIVVRNLKSRDGEKNKRCYAWFTPKASCFTFQPHEFSESDFCFDIAGRNWQGYTVDEKPIVETSPKSGKTKKGKTEKISISNAPSLFDLPKQQDKPKEEPEELPLQDGDENEFEGFWDDIIF